MWTQCGDGLHCCLNMGPCILYMAHSHSDTGQNLCTPPVPVGMLGKKRPMVERVAANLAALDTAIRICAGVIDVIPYGDQRFWTVSADHLRAAITLVDSGLQFKIAVQNFVMGSFCSAGTKTSTRQARPGNTSAPTGDYGFPEDHGRSWEEAAMEGVLKYVPFIHNMYHGASRCAGTLWMCRLFATFLSST